MKHTFANNGRNINGSETSNKPVSSEGTVLVMDVVANGIFTRTFFLGDLTVPRNCDVLFIVAEKVLTKVIMISYKQPEDIG